ncbi:MAG: ribosome recycling factor [Myxococcales bacterium]|nr:ribosome recycling factor [Myxococcales bacterium]|tara:strand:+ start:1972 stop:2529 length:558 start_codon:yes stop_codon:yes gene_type:complete
MLEDIQQDAKSQMEKAMEALKKSLSTIRTGRANVGMLDPVRVNYYGTPSPLNQVASITVADARMLMVKPWEKDLLKEIEKGILEANLGLTPATDGEVVRVPIPTLTEERRKEFVKQARNKCEDGKVAVRNARRDANDMLKTATKDGDISEDEEKRGLKAVQDLTDGYVKSVDEILNAKEAEIMEV